MATISPDASTTASAHNNPGLAAQAPAACTESPGARSSSSVAGSRSSWNASDALEDLEASVVVAVGHPATKPALHAIARSTIPQHVAPGALRPSPVNFEGGEHELATHYISLDPDSSVSSWGSSSCDGPCAGLGAATAAPDAAAAAVLTAAGAAAVLGAGAAAAELHTAASPAADPFNQEPTSPGAAGSSLNPQSGRAAGATVSMPLNAADGAAYESSDAAAHQAEEAEGPAPAAHVQEAAVAAPVSAAHEAAVEVAAAAAPVEPARRHPGVGGEQALAAAHGTEAAACIPAVSDQHEAPPAAASFPGAAADGGAAAAVPVSALAWLLPRSRAAAAPGAQQQQGVRAVHTALVARARMGKEAVGAAAGQALQAASQLRSLAPAPGVAAGFESYARRLLDAHASSLAAGAVAVGAAVAVAVCVARVRRTAA